MALERPRRVLFIAEAVTLAHVARPIVLARALASEGYEVRVACDERYRRFVTAEGLESPQVYSIPSERFLRALGRGNPVYDADTLRLYVRNDLALIEAFRPDLVVGDFRLSLSVSARLACVPYATITNAYWSPYAQDRTLPMPVLPMTRVLPLAVAQRLFGVFAPLAMRAHARPLNAVRRKHGLVPLEPDVRRIYTDADQTLYADVEALFPTLDRPVTHHYLGALLWSPAVPLPGWWKVAGQDRPLVYITLGSSGNALLLPRIVAALTTLPVDLTVATAGAVWRGAAAHNVFVASYLPGTAAAARARVVICNGGSLTSQQALARGVPVLGICSNMDQFLNMAAVQQWGAGILLRADRASADAIRRAVVCLLNEYRYTEAAGRLAQLFELHAASERFKEIISASLRHVAPACMGSNPLH